MHTLRLLLRVHTNINADFFSAHFSAGRLRPSCLVVANQESSLYFPTISTFFRINSHSQGGCDSATVSFGSDCSFSFSFGSFWKVAECESPLCSGGPVRSHRFLLSATECKVKSATAAHSTGHCSTSLHQTFHTGHWAQYFIVWRCHSVRSCDKSIYASMFHIALRCTYHFHTPKYIKILFIATLLASCYAPFEVYNVQTNVLVKFWKIMVVMMAKKNQGD